MEKIKKNKHYLDLMNWWETLDLSNYEKSIFNKEIIFFNQQLFRLKEKKIRIGTFGRAGVGKSYILNLLLNRQVFRTNIINGSTKEIRGEEWILKNQTLKSIELLDSPGFDLCDLNFPDKNYSKIYNSDLILFTVAGDLNRNEVAKINYFRSNGKKIIIVLNKIHLWEEIELKEIIANIKSKLPKDYNIPVIINSGDNIKNYIIDYLKSYGEKLLTLNSLQIADKLFSNIKEQRLRKRKKEAQSTIGKFATIKASAVALNPLIFFDIAGSFALDTALISELSKIYGLSLKGESARKIIKKISVNNLCLGATQIGINTSFNLIRKLILLSIPLTSGLSLLPYGPIAFVQAAIAVRSTKIVGKLAAKEIFLKSKESSTDPSSLIKKIIRKEPEIFNHLKVYLCNRNPKESLPFLLP